jgi:DNA-binding response OmpR family regulator
MPDSIADFLHNARPTADRPLLGHTVLLVEDSRFASEAVRLLCLRSGARIRRADTLTSANRHLRAYRPSVVVVDLGLPDGSGVDLIADLSRAQPRVGVILATSGDPGLWAAAEAAGADGFLEKPVTSLAVFQEAILSRLPAEARPPAPRALPEGRVRPDPIALREDLGRAKVLLQQSGDAAHLGYVARFLLGLARTTGDRELEAAAADMAAGGGIGWAMTLVADRLEACAPV